MDVRRELIAKLAEIDDYSFFFEIKELLPDILAEIYLSLFIRHLDIKEFNGWTTEILHSEQLIVICQDNFNYSLFYYAARLATYDKNFYYGIIGPWHKYKTVPEVQELKKVCEANKLEEWQDWMYSYFETKRDDLDKYIRLNENISFIINKLVDEFIEMMRLYKGKIENANSAICRLTRRCT